MVPPFRFHSDLSIINIKLTSRLPWKHIFHLMAYGSSKKRKRESIQDSTLAHFEDLSSGLSCAYMLTCMKNLGFPSLNLYLYRSFNNAEEIIFNSNLSSFKSVFERYKNFTKKKMENDNTILWSCNSKNLGT